MEENRKTFEEQYPDIAHAQHALAKACDGWGSLDEKTRQLIKIAFATALGSENAVKAHVAKAQAMGIEPEAIQHTILLGLPALGYPRSVAALAWANPMLGAPGLR